MEQHPFPPFIPANAKVLVMGTFPPKPQRWAMNFYYPNKINDFWRIMGWLDSGDKNQFFTPPGDFREEEIKEFLNRRGIAMHDTGRVVNRLRDNASDKFLEIVEPVHLAELINQIPGLELIATTGEKAARVISELTHTGVPKMGEQITAEYAGRRFWITRLPSTSRAYPMKLEHKAEFYKSLFR